MAKGKRGTKATEPAKTKGRRDSVKRVEGEKTTGIWKRIDGDVKGALGETNE